MYGSVVTPYGLDHTITLIDDRKFCTFTLALSQWMGVEHELNQRSVGGGSPGNSSLFSYL